MVFLSEWDTNEEALRMEDTIVVHGNRIKFEGVLATEAEAQKLCQEFIEDANREEISEEYEELYVLDENFGRLLSVVRCWLPDYVFSDLDKDFLKLFSQTIDKKTTLKDYNSFYKNVLLQFQLLYIFFVGGNNGFDEAKRAFHNVILYQV